MTEKKAYEEIEHTADWAIHVRGERIEELFERALFGMSHLAGVRLKPGSGRSRRIELNAEDLETLLILWLEENLLSIELNQCGWRKCELKIRGNRLQAQIVEADLLEISREIKAVTYHGLEIVYTGEEYFATIIFDV